MAQPITIVDKNDNPIGSAHMSEVYSEGLIHRLIRVLLFNANNELLLQWRDNTRDTFPETWDQSAGGHVDAGEDYETAATRELEEELGVKNVKLTLLGKFYTEGEIGPKTIKRFNAVFRGDYTGSLVLQDEEVSEVKWFGKEELEKELEENPDKFTLGLKTILIDYKDKLWNKS